MRPNTALDETLDPRTMTPDWYARETRLAHMLPYVSLVDHQTVRTRVNELFQCIRLDGVNSYTTDDTYLDKVTALFARIAGAEVHLMDLSAQRLAKAAKLFGFADTHQPGEDILSGDLAEGFDLVFDATGNAKAIEAGFPLVAHGGSTVLVSVVKESITFADAEFHKRESRIIGSRNAVKEDFDRVMAAIRSGAVPTEAIASAIVPLKDLPARFAKLAHDRDHLIKVIVTP